jgi:hypothetical protein
MAGRADGGAGGSRSVISWPFSRMAPARKVLLDALVGQLAVRILARRPAQVHGWAQAATVPRARRPRRGPPMSGEHEFHPGDLIRIALPGSDEDLQFVISDVRDNGGAETVSLIPDPENADVPLPWE